MAIPPKIPWHQVLRHGPKVLETATSLFEKWQARKPEPVDPNAGIHAQLDAIVERLQVLEETESSQSEVIRNMAQQIEGLAAGLTELEKRTRIAWTIAGIAVLLAAGACVALVLR